MLRIRLTARADRAAVVERALVDSAGLERVAITPAASGEGAVMEADLRLDAADELVATLERLGVPPEDFVLSHLEVVAPAPPWQTRLGGGDSFAWVEVLGEARRQARPLARYFLLMAVAGVVAGLGVIKGNAILIVGAMAVSPDLLPLCSVCVGVVGRRRRLTRRALATLLLGLALVGAMASVLTLLLELTGIISGDLVLGAGGLGGLAETDYSTVLVALVAGVAAMLSFETRASAAVGVAISVTTIPASAYWGVALGTGQASGAGGALLVLVVNVCLLIVSGSATLAVQRRLSRRAGAQA
jgi:uncharacterized hydrophobic protein (TIGR00271 family)